VPYSFNASNMYIQIHHKLRSCLIRFLGTVDKLGTAYNDPVIATGYGAYMATPILRKAYEDNGEMSKEEAIQLLYKVMQVLFYRDARSFPKVNYQNSYMHN